MQFLYPEEVEKIIPALKQGKALPVFVKDLASAEKYAFINASQKKTS